MVNLPKDFLELRRRWWKSDSREGKIIVHRRINQMVREGSITTGQAKRQAFLNDGFDTFLKLTNELLPETRATLK
jgi:hypothetical protein